MKMVKQVGLIRTEDKCLLELLSENGFLLEKFVGYADTDDGVRRVPVRNKNQYFIYIETEEPLNEKR